MVHSSNFCLTWLVLTPKSVTVTGTLVKFDQNLMEKKVAENE